MSEKKGGRRLEGRKRFLIPFVCEEFILTCIEPCLVTSSCDLLPDTPSS